MSIEIQNFKFDQPTSEVSFERLEAIEHELGGVLDNGFRELLSMINGGRPDPGLVSSIRFLEYPIIVFLGLDEGKSNLIGSHKDLSQTIGRSDLVPIERPRTMADLDAALRLLPRLGEDAASFQAAIQEVRASMKELDDPWES